MCFFLALLLASGDIVHLKSGGKVEGKVTDKKDTFEIETANGTVTLKKEDVVRIEKKEFVPPKKDPREKRRARLGAPYAHPFYAFKLYLPPQWARAKEQGNASASFIGPPDQAYQPRMNLYVEFNATDFVEYVGKYRDQISKQFKDAQFPIESTLTLHGKPAYQFSAVVSDGDPPVALQSLWTFVDAGDRKYVASYNCTQAWFPKYHAAVDASMRSLRVYALPTASKEKKQEFLRLYTKAEENYRAGKYKEALSDFQQAASIIPEFADIHSAIGTIHLKENRYADAEAAYRKALEADPEDGAHNYNLGVCLLKQTKYAAAVEALKKAVEADPLYEAALTNLGVAYLAQEKNDPARDALEKAVEADPESAPAHYNLGLAYERLSRKKDAEREFKQALSADPKHEEAKKALERLKSAK